MGYTPPKKKKNLWDQLTEGVGNAVRTVARGADAVIPGDQSSWHREAPARQVTPSRPNEPIRITAPKPTVVATFGEQKPTAIASLEQNQTRGIDINGSPDNGLQVRTALPDQKIVTVRPAGAQPDITVAKPTTQPQITVRKDPRMQSIDERLDQGKSWENISKETGIDLNTVKARSQSTRPNYGVKEQPKQNFTDYNMGEKKTKTIFGADVGQYMGDFGYTREMRVEGSAEVAPDDFVKVFDNMGDEKQKIYIQGVKKLAAEGNYAAQNTLQTLEAKGRFKGDIMDFIEGSNDRLYGGLARSTARTVELLPGDQGAGKWADDDAYKNAQFTNTGKAGETVGSVQKGVVDIASILAPSMAAEKVLKGTKFVQGLSQGDRVRKLLGYGITNVGSGAVGTAVEAFQTNGRGEDQNIARSAGIAAAIDFAAPAALKQLGRVGKYGLDAITGKASAETVDSIAGMADNIPGRTQSVVTDLIEETDPTVIQQALGVERQVAEQLASETSEEAMVETLKRLEVDPNINLSPEIRERMEREGITNVSVGDSPYRAHYDRNGRITVRTPEDATDDVLNQEVAHHVWLNRVSPEDKAAFANHKGSGYQEAVGRKGYSQDDLMSEDFTVYTSMALRGQLDQVPPEVRGVVAKYAGVVEQTKQADIAPVNTPRADVPVFSGRIDDLTKSKIDDLFARSEATPRPPGTTRVFQDPGSGANGGTPWVFDNIDSLAAYRNNVTGAGDNYVFHDVPNGSLKPTANGEHVYTMDVVPQVQTTVRSGNNMDLGTDARARFANRQLEQQTPAAEISAKYGGTVEDIQRNIDNYGEDATRNMYAAKHDSPSVNNLDAVASSELRKQFGKVTVKNAPGAEAAPVEQVAPVESIAPPAKEADIVTNNGNTVTAKDRARYGNDAHLVADVTAEYMRRIDAGDFDGANSVLTRLTESPQFGSNKEFGERVAKLSDYGKKQADNVAKQTPEAATTRTPAIKEPIATEAPLGKIAQDFYDSRTGNVKIRFNDIKAMADTVAARTYNEFRAIGSDLPRIAEITQKYVDNGIKDVNQMVELSPAEKQIWQNFQDEWDYMRRRSSLGGKEVSQGDQGNAYWSRIAKDQQPTREQLFEGFRDKKPGSEMARKTEGGLSADEISYSPAVISKYIIEHADSKLLQEERIYKAMQRNNPDLPEEQIRSAAQQVIDIQNRVNTVKTKINLGGVGKRVTVSKDGVVDFADEMKQVGEKLGKQQLDVSATPKGLTNGDRLNSVDITYKGEVHTMGDFLGLNQFRDSGAYAGTQVAKVGGNRNALAELVGERLQGAYRIPADDVEYAVESVRRIAQDVDDKVVASKVEAIYRNAAKQQLMEQLQNVNITNKTLRNDVSTLANQIVREGTIEQELSSKVVSKTLRATNALFRKLNVSSAINELSDLTSLASIYGKNLKVATPDFSLIKKYGVGEPDPALQSYIKAIDEGADVKSVLGKVNEATRLYKFVETYKAGVALKTAENFYSAAGLTGDDLTAAVLKDFRELTLPVDAFTKTFLDDYPLWTQYLTWGARNMQKEGRLLTGAIDAGVMKDKSNAQRIARNLYANIPAKTAFWLASNGLKGTAIMTAFGLTDFTGLTNQDYSGIAEEDKSFFDKTTQFTNISTVGSIINTMVQHYEKEQLKQQYAEADYNPYENNNVADQLSRQFTPQFVKNAAGSYSFSKGEMVGGAADLMQEGYSENASGRVQFEAPTDAWNTFKAYAFGKNQTANAREYSGRENLADRMQEGVNPLQAVKDMASEQLGLQDTDYNRPLTDDYSERYKAIDREARTALLEGGRTYNDYLDNLKKNEPDAYNNYIESMDGNHVNPEFWREVSADPKTFEMMRDRKKQLQTDLGTAYDPIYDLPDDQAAQVLKYKSSPTGDDIALRNMLNKEQWYKDYKAKIGEFYDKNPAGGEGFKSTERVKEWNALDDKLSSFYFDKDAKEAPAWQKDFPLVYDQKRINEKYGFDSPESKAFFKANYDGYAAQKEGYDKAQLDVINQMRKIEGYPPMSWEAYQQATEIADTDSSDDKKKGYGSGGGGGSYIDASGGSFGQAKGTDLDTIKVKVPTVSVKRKGGTPGKITVKKGGKLL